MAVLFLIFLDQICPNLIKLDFHQSKNVIIKSCHIYRKDRNDCFIFDFFWIRSVKNGSNLIKLFGQKWIFGSNGFSAETAFRPIILLSNLKCLFGHFFKWICLTSQSIERFGSPLMAESFQACSLHFQISHTKRGIFDFNHFSYLVLLFRNQIKYVENLFNF